MKTKTQSLRSATKAVAAALVDTRTPDEKYTACIARVMRNLQDMIRIGQEAREAVAKKITGEGINNLAHQVQWGYGVKEDLTAGYAAEIVAALLTHEMMIVLEYTVRTFRYNQKNNRYSGGSSSAFSNAVDAVRADVERSLAERCEYWLSDLIEARAEMEVL